MVVEPRVGKGSPALGTLGTVMAFTGAAAALAGVGLLVFGGLTIRYFSPDGDSAPWDASVGDAAGIMTLLGATMATAGVYLMEHNRGASVRVRVLPNSIAATF